MTALTYRPERAGDLRVAVDVEVLADTAAEVVLRELSGWVVVGPVLLGEQLIAGGATARRRYEVMDRRLDTDPPSGAWADADLGPGRRAVALDHRPEDVFPAWRAAYPAGHPDWRERSDAEALDHELVPLLAGHEGSVQPCSRLAEDQAAGRVLAGVIVIDLPGAGAWIADVFRDPAPEFSGLGAALLKRALAAAARDGVPRIGLSVTTGNPARAGYRRLGLVATRQMLTVVVP